MQVQKGSAVTQAPGVVGALGAGSVSGGPELGLEGEVKDARLAGQREKIQTDLGNPARLTSHMRRTSWEVTENQC